MLYYMYVDVQCLPSRGQACTLSSGTAHAVPKSVTQGPYLLPRTFCVSSSLPSKPRFRTCLALGASSRGVAPSARDKAARIATALANCIFS